MGDGRPGVRRPSGEHYGHRYLLRAERISVEPGNKQIQIYGTSDFGCLPIYVLCPRHFFVDGSTTLAMCEIKRSVYFCPKKIRVSRLCTSNFGIRIYIFIRVSVSLPILFLQITYVLDDIFANRHTGRPLAHCRGPQTRQRAPPPSQFHHQCATKLPHFAVSIRVEYVDCIWPATC